MRALRARSLAPVIAHVVATTTDDVAACVTELERCEAIAAIRVGVHDQATPRDVELVLRTAQGRDDVTAAGAPAAVQRADAGTAAQEAGAGAIVVAAPPRGTTRR
jgi:hypothetical protein